MVELKAEQKHKTEIILRRSATNASWAQDSGANSESLQIEIINLVTHLKGITIYLEPDQSFGH